MKKLLFVLLFFPAIVGAAGRNINGTTGYIVMPNGEGLRFQQYNLGLSSFSGTEEIQSHWKYNMGLGWAEWIEVTFQGRSEREGLYLNLKWFGTLNDYEDPLYVAIGFENLSSMGTFQDNPDMYMVTTKKFQGGHSFSLGFVGRYVGREVVASAMCGGEYYTSEYLSWLADVVAYDGNKYNLNAGVRVYTSDTMYFNFMLVNMVHSRITQIDENGKEVELNPLYGMLGMTITDFM
ncbi:MAG: hypothetical protein LBQ83_02150 [Candidatus Margulisbacteria bacterium]|jgi:hypothetical protein|nr:hypothetical protein [Candidatus Margulisiibacteriota bacterium]